MADETSELLNYDTIVILKHCDGPTFSIPILFLINIAVIVRKLLIAPR